jgi:DNA-binding beta-propeller fold protein YncE
LSPHGFPTTGLVLLSLTDGSLRASASVGTDPVAVIVSNDGATAYLADSSPGDVYAVRLPGLSVAWKSHVGGAPFGLLLHAGRLFVSLFSGAAVVELDPASGAQLVSHPVSPGPAVLGVAPDGRVMVAGTRGIVDYLDGTSTPAGHGFAVAVIDGQIWTEDYERAELVRTGDGRRVGLPLPLFPFWLAPGAPGTLLIAAEGGTEDTDPGGVFSLDKAGTFKSLARPTDPDQVLQSGSTILVAAHGDREVLAINGGVTEHWGIGAAPVAIALDPIQNMLLVAVNAHE